MIPPMTDNMVPQYKPVSVTDASVPGPNGFSIPGKRITVQFHNGDILSIEVPFQQGWEGQAQTEIEALADAHDKLMSMQGPQVPASTRTPISLRQVG